jgi:probable DNA metabolism protein
MSELPIHAETIRFGRKVLTAADAAGQNLPAGQREEAERCAAGRAAVDRGDPDTQIVLNAAYKVRREIHRLMGFLRFSPADDGMYVARCVPDYLTLPVLCEHFTQRFGDTPWIIIDEKRRLCLRRLDGEAPRLLALDELSQPPISLQPASAGWENLWRHYHKTINNESRNNPGLQRRFMPKRYWKYLPEM